MEGCVGMKEGREVRRCKVMESLEGEKENLIIDALFDREPVKLLKDGGDVFCGRGSGNDAGSGV